MTGQLTITGLTKRFEVGTPNEKLALDDVSLSVAPGEFVTILGSNGAGKSTLFNAILGKFVPDAGHLVLDGQDITFLKDHRRALHIGCLFQNPLRGTAPNMTIEENLAMAYTRNASKTFFAVNRRDSDHFRALLASLNLGLEDRMKTRMGQLSGGQRQAASLLMATIAKPKLLLLDEHTAALDPATSAKVLETTRKIVADAQLTTLMITHDMAMALDFGTRTIMMDTGKVVLDVAGADRAALTPRSLVDLFVTRAHRGLDDRTMLAL
jgi:putative ABC transport system ATP-binding protein